MEINRFIVARNEMFTPPVSTAPEPPVAVTQVEPQPIKPGTETVSQKEIIRLQNQVNETVRRLDQVLKNQQKLIEAIAGFRQQIEEIPNLKQQIVELNIRIADLENHGIQSGKSPKAVKPAVSQYSQEQIEELKAKGVIKSEDLVNKRGEPYTGSALTRAVNAAINRKQIETSAQIPTEDDIGPQSEVPEADWTTPDAPGEENVPEAITTVQGSSETAAAKISEGVDDLENQWTTPDAAGDQEDTAAEETLDQRETVTSEPLMIASGDYLALFKAAYAANPDSCQNLSEQYNAGRISRDDFINGILAANPHIRITEHLSGKPNDASYDNWITTIAETAKQRGISLTREQITTINQERQRYLYEGMPTFPLEDMVERYRPQTPAVPARPNDRSSTEQQLEEPGIARLAEEIEHSGGVQAAAGLPRTPMIPRYEDYYPDDSQNPEVDTTANLTPVAPTISSAPADEVIDPNITENQIQRIIPNYIPQGFDLDPKEIPDIIREYQEISVQGKIPSLSEIIANHIPAYNMPISLGSTSLTPITAIMMEQNGITKISPRDAANFFARCLQIRAEKPDLSPEEVDALAFEEMKDALKAASSANESQTSQVAPEDNAPPASADVITVTKGSNSASVVTAEELPATAAIAPAGEPAPATSTVDENNKPYSLDRYFLPSNLVTEMQKVGINQLSYNQVTEFNNHLAEIRKSEPTLSPADAEKKAFADILPKWQPAFNPPPTPPPAPTASQ